MERNFARFAKQYISNDITALPAGVGSSKGNLLPVSNSKASCDPSFRVGSGCCQEIDSVLTFRYRRYVLIRLAATDLDFLGMSSNFDPLDLDNVKFLALQGRFLCPADL